MPQDPLITQPDPPISYNEAMRLECGPPMEFADEDGETYPACDLKTARDSLVGLNF